MKKLFVLLILFPLFGFSQDSCHLQKEKDKFTNEVTITSGFISLPYASLTIQATAKEIDFFFTLTGEGKCFDYESVVNVLFEGGKVKTNYKSSGTVNCDGYFHFSFRNGPTTSALLDRIATKKIISMKFTGTLKKETEIELTPEQQQAIMTYTTCIINESKKLLQ